MTGILTQRRLGPMGVGVWLRRVRGFGVRCPTHPSDRPLSRIVVLAFRGVSILLATIY